MSTKMNNYVEPAKAFHFGSKMHLYVDFDVVVVKPRQPHQILLLGFGRVLIYTNNDEKDFRFQYGEKWLI